jgi:predicted nucleic acid-binding protein
VIVDTSAILAFFDRDEPDHEAVAAVLSQSSEPLVVSPYVIAEVDYLVGSRLGVAAEIAALRELAGGAWDLATIDVVDLARTVPILERYADHAIGVADASNVVLADRYQTTTVATLDRRHFSVLRPLSGGYFAIVP